MVDVELKDGSLVVSRPPGFLERELTYNKSSYDIRTRKMRFTQEKLYSMSDRDGVLMLVTMPGFAHRVLSALRSAGVPHTFSDSRTPFPKPDIGRAMAFARDYQVEIIYNMLAAQGGILEGPTGLGKTAIAASMFNAFDHMQWCLRNTPLCLFACPAKDINRKNADELRRFLPDRDVGCVMSGVSKWSDDIMCITLDSLHLVDPSEVGMLVVDEMHTLASDTRAEALSKFMKAMRFGVSATPEGRSDNKDIVAEGLLGPVVVRKTYQDMVKAGALVPIEVCWLPLPVPSIGFDRYSRYKLREKKVLYALEENEFLSREIADILRSSKTGTQVLCMTQHINQISNIHKLCDGDVRYMHADTSFKRTARNGESYTLEYPTVGPVSAKERKQAYEDFKSGAIMKMVASGAWSTGVDFPMLDVVINAYGASSSILTKQVAGRASRKSKDKDVAYIVEFWPSWDREEPGNEPGPNMRAAMARRKSYKELGFTQRWIDNFKDLPFVDAAEAAKTLTANSPPRTSVQTAPLPF